MLSILIDTDFVDEFKINPENCTSVKVAFEDITQVGSHLVEVVMIVVALVFCKLLVQYLLKARVKSILPFFQTSGMKLN
jgi:hypothetical protein